MSLKFVVHGIEVTASDAAEAAKLIRELGAQASSTAATPAKPQVNGKHRAPARSKPRFVIAPRKPRINLPFNPSRGALAFLAAIKDGGDRGVSGEELMSPLQVNHIKGVGSRIGNINGQLAKLGFAPDSVYSTRRTSEGRFFIPAKDFEVALETAKKAAR